MSETGALLAELAARWRELSTALWTVEQDTAAHAALPWIPESTAGAWRTRAAGLRTTLTRLSPEGELTIDVLAGRAEPARWDRVARSVAEGLRTLAADLRSDVILDRVWSELVVQTAEDLGELPGQVAEQVAKVADRSNVTLGLVSLVLGLWVLNKVIP